MNKNLQHLTRKNFRLVKITDRVCEVIPILWIFTAIWFILKFISMKFWVDKIKIFLTINFPWECLYIDCDDDEVDIMLWNQGWSCWVQQRGFLDVWRVTSIYSSMLRATIFYLGTQRATWINRVVWTVSALSVWSWHRNLFLLFRLQKDSRRMWNYNFLRDPSLWCFRGSQREMFEMKTSLVLYTI